MKSSTYWWTSKNNNNLFDFLVIYLKYDGKLYHNSKPYFGYKNT